MSRVLAQAHKRLESVRREQARRHLIRFTTAVQEDYDVQWFHRLLADKLDAVRRGECRRLLVFMPPQHGKSELISRKFPAHVLGNNPDTRIIATSYSEDLAKFNARKVRHIMAHRAYHDVFGDVRTADKTTATDAANQAVYFEIPGRRGYLKSAGIMGAMTGFGFDIGLIDDPIKNMAEADSETYRKRLKDAFSSVFETRGSGLADGKGDRIVGVFTRWHHDDLAGWLLETAGEFDDDWEVISLPAVLDVEPKSYDPRAHMETLWPGRYPLEELHRRKRKMVPRVWEALYQQRPTPESGGLFKSAWWKYFDRDEVEYLLRTRSYDQVFTSWDLSFKKSGNSRVAGLVFMTKGPKIFILDLDVDHMGYTEAKAAFRRMSEKWPMATSHVVEDKANGPALISDLSGEIGGIVAWPPEGEPLEAKEARWNASTPWLKAGDIFLPPAGEASSGWVDDEFLPEMKAVPAGAHDDIADAFAQGVAFAKQGFNFDGLAGW